MRSSRVGRYILFVVVAMFVLGAWMALRATERQLKRLARSHAPEPSNAASPSPTQRPAELRGATGPTGAADGESASTTASTPTSTESDGRKDVPPGAIW